MSFLYQHFLSQYLVFTLVLARVSGVVMTAPVFGTAEVPARIRAMLAVALAVLAMPLAIARPVDSPATLVGYAIVAASEAIIGLVLGLGVMLLFSGVQIAGQVIAQVSGLQLADVFNPGFDASVPIFSHLLYLVTLAVFVLIGGHRLVLEALLDTLVNLPPGSAVTSDLVETFTTLLGQSFSLGVRAAAPTMTALLLATLVLGLISRTLPQLNVMAVGFSISSLVTLVALAVSLGAAAWIFQEQVQPMLDLVTGALDG